MSRVPAPTTLQELCDREAIRDVKQAYAHGVDRRDWPLYRSVFTDEVAFDFSDFGDFNDTMSADVWVGLVKGNLANFDATQHVFTGHEIVFEAGGDAATCVTQMTARHQLGDEAQVMGGYYTERLVRTSDGWKIASCKLNITWEEGTRDLFERTAALGPRARRDVGMQGV